MKLTDIEESYIECALWASTDEAGNPLGDAYSIHDIDTDGLRNARAYCRCFEDLCADADLPFPPPYGHPQYTDEEMCGHDIFLTQNGHGAGFWDRGLEHGDRYTELAKGLGEAYVLETDENEITITY